MDDDADDYGDDFGGPLLAPREVRCGCGRRLHPDDDAADCMWCGWLADQRAKDAGEGEE